MRPSPIAGVIERRLLVNYRTDPQVTARLLPAPLRPKLVNGWSVAGICLIRLGRLRPRYVRPTREWTATTLFATLDQASHFFRQDATGYSATSDERCLDGLELQTSAWQVEPAEILDAYSTFFDDTTCSRPARQLSTAPC